MERGGKRDGKRGWKTANGERGGHVRALDSGDHVPKRERDFEKLKSVVIHNEAKKV